MQPRRLAPRLRVPRSMGSMLRIERSVEGGEVRLVLSGGIQGETLAKLERTIASETVVPVAISIDLAEVRLVDREAVRFLVECEAGGIRLANCPAYVREWIGTDQTR
jgi:hypothetical protein